MPVTAKLSSKFYQRLGDDVANELVGLLNTMDSTYLSELRTLNELNFVRFDAKLEQRLAEQDARIEGRFATQEVSLERRFAAQEVSLQQRFAAQEVSLERRFAAQEVSLERRFAAQEVSLERRFGELRVEIKSSHNDLLKWLIVLFVPTYLGLVGVMLAVLRVR